jgi:hypothetical protein
VDGVGWGNYVAIAAPEQNLCWQSWQYDIGNDWGGVICARGDVNVDIHSICILVDLIMEISDLKDMVMNRLSLHCKIWYKNQSSLLRTKRQPVLNPIETRSNQR